MDLFKESEYENIGEYLQRASNFFLEKVVFKFTTRMVHVVNDISYLKRGLTIYSNSSKIYSNAMYNLQDTEKQAYLSPAA